MNQTDLNSIGISGKKWGEKEKLKWLSQQCVKRSYQEDVVAKLQALKGPFIVEQYGALPIDVKAYPLFAVKNCHWNYAAPTVLITGGVHGYETSGVQGAIRFLERDAQNYSEFFNIVIAPCVSPWGYETINRWNPYCVDPNRSFIENSPSQESAALMKYIASLDKNSEIRVTAHIDLHETTNTDNTEFRPALAARDAVEHTNWNIPDGFYLVGDTEKPASEFQRSIIKSVEKITHIAPADNNGKIIGKCLSQQGVINYATKELGLCTGFTNACFKTTTEVYPDSPKVDDENCIDAQVAAITGGLNYIISTLAKQQEN